MIAIANFEALEPTESRRKSVFQQRLQWDNFVENYQHKPLFCHHLRMSYESFCLLLDRLRDHLTTNETMGALRGGNIIPELQLYATICYLAGANYTDVCFFVVFRAPLSTVLFGKQFGQLTKR